MIRVTNLVKKFDKLTAVDDVSFNVEAGEIFAFLGPNGAGKTTTIKMLTTLLHPTSGSIELDGLNPQTHQHEARQRFGIRGLKAPASSKRRIFQRPQSKNAMMSGDGLDAFPEQFPRGIRHGKIRVTFAVEQGMLADDLDANRADDLPPGRFNHLKFSQPPFQFVCRQPHGFPKRPQALKIIRGGAANTQLGRTHAGV